MIGFRELCQVEETYAHIVKVRPFARRETPKEYSQLSPNENDDPTETKEVDCNRTRVQVAR
jgi:hypothetical protein